MGQASNGELDISKVIRVSIESYRDPAVSQLQIFKNVCFGARNVEKLFLMINRGNKSVTAVIGYENLDPEIGTTTNAGCVPSECIMKSNIGQYCPYWSDPRSRAITRLHMPSKILQEVFVEEISILEEMWGWTTVGTDWKIKPRSMSFLENQDADADVKHVEEIARDVLKVSWRGHFFVLKITSSDEEFNYLKRLVPHPNIVSGFGMLRERSGDNNPVRKAYLMEFISGRDLLHLIVDKIRRHKNLPPFPSHDALDILWKFANAVKHMHQEGVVHCDLKSQNVLISNTASMSETTPLYLVKVADFGSATESRGPKAFIAGMGTDCYATPKTLEQRKNTSFVTNHPEKIDAYSFGVVTFELLTREIYAQYCKMYVFSTFKANVIDGILRPLLREKCKAHIERSQNWRFSNLWRREREFFERYWHLQQENLISH